MSEAEKYLRHQTLGRHLLSKFPELDAALGREAPGTERTGEGVRPPLDVTAALVGEMLAVPQITEEGRMRYLELC